MFASCMPRVQLYVNACNGWPQFALQHHWLLPINCHFLRLYSAAGRGIAAVSSAIEESDLYLYLYLRQLDYSTRLDILGLWSLEERRNRADLIEVFYIMRGFSLISVDEFFEVNNRDVARPGLGGLKPPQT